MLYPDLVDIPFELFGGYCPAIPPSDLSPGAASICDDCIFPQGGLRTRGGLRNAFPVGSPIPVNASINGLKSYITPSLGQRLMAWDSSGNLYKETPQGTLNLIFTRPYASLFYQSQTIFGREYQAFFNSLGGFDIPRQYDDTFWDRVSQVGPGVSPSATDSGTAGNIASGKHQVSVAFITRQGFITQAAPPVTWTAAGSKQVSLTNIPVGPPNIVARLILFTPVITPPATTGSFYSTPNGTSQLATPTTMLINDNTTTAITLDFTDAILIAGFQANYLFTQIELGESAFTIGYNSRGVWMGERNKIQNLVNLTFDGGFGGAPSSTNVGPNSPSAATVSGIGTAWANPTNVFSADGVLASCSLLSGNNSDYLNATGYGFSIPSNASIVGIVVQALVKANSATGLTDFSVMLLKNGTRVGADHANGNIWTTILANQTYGSSGDLWGTTWTPADINDPNFGVAYAAQNINLISTLTASIDYISVKVYYTTPSAGAAPTGWTQGASFAGGGSALASSLTADWGDAFAITGDGATAIRGQITQSAYQDYLLLPIIARNTAYRVRARVASAGGLAQGALHVNLQSTSGAFTTAGLAIQSGQLTASYQEFDALLTTAIVSPPTDLLLQVYADGTPTNNGVFLIDSIEVYPASTPFNYSVARFSHAFNPESFDATTGQIQVRPNDGQQLRAGFPLRNNLYLAKDHYLCYVQDDGVNEPSSWAVNEVSSTIGICGPNAVDYTEEWAVFAERSGFYICWGSDPVKISPEMMRDASGTGKVSWDSINWTLGHTIWVRIDKVNRMILIGVPIGETLGPNKVFMMDYRWLDSAQDIASASMVTYSSFTGKILSHGRGRRWSIWNITANSMAFAERSDGTAQPFFGNGSHNGKIYQQFDCSLQPSDDGVAIPWKYQGYGCPASMEEQAFQLSGHRKLLGFMSFRATGIGLLPLSIVTTLRTTLLRSYTMSLTPIGDGNRRVNVHGERFFPTIGPNTVATSWFQLEKLILSVKKDSCVPIGSGAA